MTELEFQSLARQGFNRIPLIAEAFADLETPLSLYLKLTGTRDGRTAPYSFLLESVVGGEKRESVVGDRRGEELESMVEDRGQDTPAACPYRADSVGQGCQRMGYGL